MALTLFCLVFSRPYLVRSRVALMLQAYVRLSVCDVCIVAKRCVEMTVNRKWPLI